MEVGVEDDQEEAVDLQEHYQEVSQDIFRV